MLQPAPDRPSPDGAALDRLRRRPRTNHVVPYHGVLELLAGCESVKTTVLRRRLVWAGGVVNSDAKRLQRRVVFGELEQYHQQTKGDGEGVVPRG